MTKFTSRSFSVHLGSKEYRDNYDRVFGSRDGAVGDVPEPEMTAAERDAALYRRDGMPEDVIASIVKCRERGDRKWAEGRKESADFERRTAKEIADGWYKSVGKEPPK